MPVDRLLDDGHGVSDRDACAYLEIRIHTPATAITVVRINGELDIQTVLLMIKRVSEQILRTDHVVVDLSGIGFLGSGCLTALRNLRASAMGRGATLHWAGARDKAVLRPLALTGLDRKLRMYSVPADAVVSRLRLECPLNAVSRRRSEAGR